MEYVTAVVLLNFNVRILFREHVVSNIVLLLKISNDTFYEPLEQYEGNQVQILGHFKIYGQQVYVVAVGI